MASTAITMVVPSSDDLGSACVLLGSITFMMGMIYLLLNQDADVRHYSWKGLTAGISNFLGALIARSFGDNIAFHVVGPDASQSDAVVVWACICAAWYLLLQFVLLLAACDKIHHERMILNLKCFGVLFSLVTGFSNLTLWGTVQDLYVSSIPWTAPVVLLSLSFISGFCYQIRCFIARIEHDSEHLSEKAWRKYCRETENAVMTLTLAHVMVQKVRYNISGVPPQPTGADPPDFEPTLMDGIHLELFADLFLVLFLISDFVIPSSCPRLKVWLKGAIGNAFAFCAFYAIDWYTKTFSSVGGNDRVLLVALFVTIAAFLSLSILHRLAILTCTPKWFEEEVKALVGPASFMVGYAWKEATLSAIDVINNKTPMPKTLNEVVLTCAIAVIVVPAWRWYILPVVMGMENPVPEMAPAPEIAAAAADSYKKLSSTLIDKEEGRQCQCHVS